VIIEEAGFEEVEVGSRTDIFAGSGGEASAGQFGTLGITFRAVKPTD
jgi:hypothetical protein